MALYNNVFIGHVETINLENYESPNPTESKVIALRFTGIDKINKIPKYRPLRKYSEYYKLIKVEPLDGLVNDKMINQAIQKTGKQEVKQLKKLPKW